MFVIGLLATLDQRPDGFHLPFALLSCGEFTVVLGMASHCIPRIK